MDERVGEAKESVIMESGAGFYRLDKKKTSDLPEIIASMLVLDLLTDLTPKKKDIGEVHADAVMALIRSEAGKHADLPYGITADVSSEELLLRSPEARPGADPDTDGPFVSAVYVSASDLKESEIKALTDPGDERNRYTKLFDCDKISSIASLEGIEEFPFYEIRKRRDGDHMTISAPDGRPCTKKVGDYLTDLKLSVDEKEKIRVMAVGSEVLWVIGRRMGDSAKLDGDTVNILKLEVKE